MSTPAANLAGRRIVITRSADDCAEWANEIARRGGAPVVLPCIDCEMLDSPDLRAALDPAAADADWLIFTSRRGVDAFGALRPAPLAPHTRIATVGAATAAAAEERFGRADLIGRGGTAEALAATLIAEGRLDTRPNVVIAVAANAGDVLARELTAAGARCTRFDVYRTIPARETAPKRAWSSLGADNVVFASPSAVEGFVHQVAIDAPIAVYTIGPSTSAAARAAGLTVTAEAREPSLEAILEAMQWRN
jgi:uroporphyrinogen-III synthase